MSSGRIEAKEAGFCQEKVMTLRSVKKKKLIVYFGTSTIVTQRRFTHRPNTPWPRAPRNSFLWRLIINLKIAKLRRNITSQFTSKRAKMQTSRLLSVQ